MTMEKNLEKRLATYYFIFLYWNPIRELYVRLPYIESFSDDVEVDYVTDGYIEDLKLMQREIRLG